MLLSILLQTNINDIVFRTMDVITVVGGVASLLTIFFTLKNKIENNSDKIVAQKEIIEELKEEMETIKLENGGFKTKIFEKFDEQNKELHKMGLTLEGLLAQLKK